MTDNNQNFQEGESLYNKDTIAPEKLTAREPSSSKPASQLNVWIVILHWQGVHHTMTCLNSLRQVTYRPFKILVVDNGSPTSDGEVIAKQFPEIKLLRLPENKGFSGGCNAGIEYAIQEGADWIWLLNNDTKVHEESLGLLVREAHRSPQAGALGAVVLTGAGEQFAASGRGEIDFRKAKTYLKQDIDESKDTVICEWLSGSNLLLRTDAICQCGSFDDRYFLYFEDTELCYRLRQHGWQCLLVPKAKVEHVGGASTDGGRRWWRAYYYTRNRLLFFVEALKGKNPLPALFYISGHLIRHTLVLPFRGEKGKNQLRAEYLGLRDYLDKRLGQATCLDWCDK